MRGEWGLGSEARREPKSLFICCEVGSDSTRGMWWSEGGRCVPTAAGLGGGGRSAALLGVPLERKVEEADWERERKRAGFGSEWKGGEKARGLGLCLDRAGEIQTHGAQPLASQKKYLFYSPFLLLLVSKIKFWSSSFAFLRS